MNTQSTRNRIQFECPERLATRLEAYTARTGLGASEVIRAALVRYLDTTPLPAQENSSVKHAKITLFDQQGDPQSAGTVAVRANGLSYGEWLMGGEHVMSRPLGLIRRIARDWFDDGGERAYEGQDEKAGVVFRVEPA